MRERDRTTPALRRVVEGTGMDVHAGSKPSKLGYSPEGGEAGMSPGPGREGEAEILMLPDLVALEE